MASKLSVLAPTRTGALGVGVLGASRIVDKAFLAPARERGDVSLECIGARELARAQQFAEAHGIGRAHGSYEAVLADEAVKLVYIALPNALHLPWAERALRAGKHVLVEKPMADEPTELARVFDLAEELGLLCVEAQHSRYHALHQPFIEACGALGKLESVTARFDAAIPDQTDIRHDPALGAGVMRDFGCYAALWAHAAVQGEALHLTEVKAVTSGRGVDLAVDVRLAAEGGAEVRLLCDMRPEVSFTASVVVQGELGRVTYDNPLVVEGSSLTLSGKGDAAAWGARTEGAGPSTYRAQLDAVIAAIANGRAPSGARAESLIVAKLLGDVLARVK